MSVTVRSQDAAIPVRVRVRARVRIKVRITVKANVSVGVSEFVSFSNYPHPRERAHE